jgi:GAF domain-containing protein
MPPMSGVDDDTDAAPPPAASPAQHRALAAPPVNGSVAHGAERDLWLTNRVLETLAPARDRADLLERLDSLLREVFPHDAGLIVTVDPADPARLNVAGSHGFTGVGRLPDPLTAGALIDPWTLEDGPLHIPDLENTSLRVADLFAGNRIRSLLSIPVAAAPDGSSEAVLILAHREVGAFAGIPDRSLQQLRRTVAVPLAHALRAAEQQRQARAWLAQSERLWESAGSGEGPDQVLHGYLVQALEISGADAGAVKAALGDPAALYVRASLGLPTVDLANGVPAASGAEQAALRTGAPHWSRQPQGPDGGPGADARFRAYLGLPAQAAGSTAPAGLISLYWRAGVAELAPEAMGLLAALARAVAVTLEREALLARRTESELLSDQLHKHKARLLSLIGHELRTPMTSIGGYAQLIVRRGDPASGAVRYAETIALESRRMATLIDNVMELSRLEDSLLTMQPRPFALGPLLDDLRGDAALRSLAPNGLEWEVPSLLPVVSGDPDGLRQALFALARWAAACQGPDGAPLPVAVRAAGPSVVAIRLGATSGPVTMLDGPQLADQINLRNVIASPTAPQDELAMYAAIQLLQAMGAGLRAETDAEGQVAYVVTARALTEATHAPRLQD